MLANFVDAAANQPTTPGEEERGKALKLYFGTHHAAACAALDTAEMTVEAAELVGCETLRKRVKALADVVCCLVAYSDSGSAGVVEAAEECYFSSLFHCLNVLRVIKKIEREGKRS